MKVWIRKILDQIHFVSVKVLVYISLALFSALAILNILITTYFNEKYDEWSLYRLDRPILFAVFLAGAVIVFLAADHKYPLSKIKAGRLTGALMIFAFVISVIWVIITHSSPVADRQFVSMIAEDFIKGNYSAFDVGHYLYKYPYQLGITAFIEIIYRVAGSGYYKAVQLLNAVAVCVIFYALFRIARILFGEKSSKAVLIILFGSFCTMFFCTYVYGNLFGLAFAVLAVWMQLVYMERRKIINILLAIISISIALLLKNNFSIILIAMLLMLGVDFLKKREALSLIFAVLMFSCTVLSSNTLNSYYSNRAGMRINEGVPMVSFIAMGLQDGWFGKGTYSRYTVDVYESVNYNEAKAAEISKDKIREQLEYYTKNPGSGAKFFLEKTSLQWAEPTYMSIWESNCADNHTQEISNYTQSMYTGFWHDFVVGFMNLYQSLVWTCASYFLIRKRKTLTAAQMLPGMIIIGGFICHIFWEAKSQYTIQYFMFAIPYAAAGFLEMAGASKRFLRMKYEKSKKESKKDTQ